MIKQIVSIAVLGAALMSGTGCSSDSGFQKYKGIEYKIVKDGKASRKIQIGDMVEFHLTAKADTMVIADTRSQPGPAPKIPVQEPTASGQFQAVFTKLGAGDSAVLEISCDTMLKANPIPPGQQAPPWLKSGKKITVTISILSVKSKEEDEKERAQKAAEQTANEEKQIQDYLTKNNIKASKTASGLYYVINEPGAGANVAAGQVVSMKYTGKTLDGRAFDSNIDTSIGHHGTDPLTFAVGQHQMIAGFDEGAALLKKGSKATLILPSKLGYGEQGPPNIGPNAVLVFDVIVTDVKDAPKQEATAGAPPVK